jgi:hypothetical protein
MLDPSSLEFCDEHHVWHGRVEGAVENDPAELAARKGQEDVCSA